VFIELKSKDKFSKQLKYCAQSKTLGNVKAAYLSADKNEAASQFTFCTNSSDRKI